MSIEVTAIPIVNGGNFIYSPAMQIGSSNNKPLNLLVNGVEQISITDTLTEIKNTLAIDKSLDTPIEGAVPIFSTSVGNSSVVLTQESYIKIFSPIDNRFFLIPCYEL